MRIAVVIPALDEAREIGGAIRSVSRAGCREVDVDVLVVDGGSRDGTAECARAAGARVISSRPGRALQLETGWRAISGDVVLFLHADTRLETGWTDALSRALADPSAAGGAFRLRFDHRSPALRLIEWGVALRVWLFALPYGDQAIFVRRSVLAAIGGVPQAPIMEDLDLVRAIEAHGRVVVLAEAAITSARRYLAGGPLRTMGRHWLALVAWRLGIDRARVARWVRR